MKGTTIFCVLLVLHITTGIRPGYLQDHFTAEPGPWSQWTACSTSCGRGTRQQTRSCIDQKDLRPCSDEIKRKVGMFRDYVKKEVCNLRNCPVDGGWSDWTNWSECSQSCREGASKGEIGDTQPYRIRSKYCTNPRAAFGGKKCARQEGINVKYYSATGTLDEKGDCESNLPFCPGTEVVYGHSHGVDKSHHISGPPLLKRGNERRRNTGLDLSPISILNHYG